MRKGRVVILLLASVLVFASCATKVSRIDEDSVTDLSGYWNDIDVRTVADDLVTKCVNAPAISNFIAENGRLPVVIVGRFRNQSDEHIDTSILAKKFEAALINSGKVDFVASSDERADIRAEREDQQTQASEETAKSLANETGADFMLLGSVKTIVDSSGKESIRTYYVDAQLVNIETNRKMWVESNSEIKKYIKRASTRF
ncbi:MAG: penicillin-binding protein activator LpoB [Treponema sp. CETP13]|nr:MAG: penicillin-binding protein activator LpoB [Treponema sp. CETP13]